jgi:hypothetical protein
MTCICHNNYKLLTELTHVEDIGDVSCDDSSGISNRNCDGIKSFLLSICLSVQTVDVFCRQ